jgi:hypothetical protein
LLLDQRQHNADGEMFTMGALRRLSWEREKRVKVHPTADAPAAMHLALLHLFYNGCRAPRESKEVLFLICFMALRRAR